MDDIYKTIIELQNQIRVLEQRVDDLEDIVSNVPDDVVP